MVILIVVLQFNLLPKFHFSKISIKRDKCDINCKKTYRRHLEIDEKLSKNSDQLRAQPKSKLCLLPVAGLRITKYQSRYFYHYQILQDKKHFLHYIIYITFYLKTKCNSDIIWNWMINVPDFFITNRDRGFKKQNPKRETQTKQHQHKTAPNDTTP